MSDLTDHPDPQLVEHLVLALIASTGGRELWTAADQHFGEGVSLRQLAQWRGIPRATLHDRLDRLFSFLEGHDILPPTWRRQPRSTRAPKITSTSKELFAPLSEQRRTRLTKRAEADD